MINTTILCFLSKGYTTVPLGAGPSSPWMEDAVQGNAVKSVPRRMRTKVVRHQGALRTLED